MVSFGWVGLTWKYLRFFSFALLTESLVSVDAMKYLPYACAFSLLISFQS
uniref:Uncharacterized protein n=1 Tax=uncultured marine virus TaxID=186617 RepID=A0A0F7LC69_9VIRU|nr:hypothetical protein [uncultured marine virus]